MQPPHIRDYARVLDVVTSIVESFDDATPWQTVGRELTYSLFDAEVFLFAEIDYTSLTSHFVATVSASPAGELPPGATVPDVLIHDHPFSWHYGSGGGSTEVLRISDLVAPLVWRNTAGYSTIRELFGTVHSLAIPVQGKPFRGLGVLRSADDFTERDVALARRLQPLLTAADRHLLALRRWHAQAAGGAGQDASAGPGGGRDDDTLAADQDGSPLRVAAALGVTPRELNVLVALSDGLTASGIARRLGISPRTVGNHLASLYRKLGASDRLTAVLHAQHEGLLPGGAGGQPTPRRPAAGRDQPSGAGQLPRPAGADGAGPPLTGREREVATLAGRGLTNKEIADQLTVSVRTVEFHLRHAYRKLGISSRAGLTANG